VGREGVGEVPGGVLPPWMDPGVDPGVIGRDVVGMITLVGRPFPRGRCDEGVELGVGVVVEVVAPPLLEPPPPDPPPPELQFRVRKLRKSPYVTVAGEALSVPTTRK
jgi:hypothetical protein